MSTPIRLLALLAVLAAAAQAGVIRVPQDYAHLQVAANHAVDGDVILVQPGTYAGPLDIGGKSLVVAGDGGPVTLPRIRVHDLAAGQVVVLAGVGATGSKALFPFGPWQEALVIENCAGRVVVQDADFRGFQGSNYMNQLGTPLFHPSGWDAVRILNATSVHFTRCTLSGGSGADIEEEDAQLGAGSGGEGLAAALVLVGLHDCELIGGFGGSVLDTVTSSGGDGGSGATLAGGVLFAAGSAFTGLAGGSGDCDFFGCGGGGDGGDGVSIAAAAPLPGDFWQHADTLAAGAGGHGGSVGGPAGPDGADGKPVDLQPGAQHEILHLPLRRLDATTLAREGQAVTLSLDALPGDLAFAWVSTRPDWTLVPDAHGVVLIDRLAPGNLLLPLGRVAPDGQLDVGFTVPDLGPGVSALTFFVQGVSVAGGSTWLASASAVTLLDAGL